MQYFARMEGDDEDDDEEDEEGETEESDERLAAAAAEPWEARTLELIALLAASAPQLRRLEHWHPEWAPHGTHRCPSVLPAALGQLSQLTSLTLGFTYTYFTSEQVGFL